MAYLSTYTFIKLLSGNIVCSCLEIGLKSENTIVRVFLPKPGSKVCDNCPHWLGHTVCGLRSSALQAKEKHGKIIQSGAIVCGKMCK